MKVPLVQRRGPRVAGILAAGCVLLELALRLAGLPRGTFAPLFPAARGLYPPGFTMSMTWGPIPYTVKANSLGYRGEAFSLNKAEGCLRIVTIGDSVTDGFFVDNDATWQPQLQRMLTQQWARPVEVINCARGGGSIDRQFCNLKRFGLPLKPDIVMLTFVGNDISDILGSSASDLLAYCDENPASSMKMVVIRSLLTRTALGESLFDGYLRVLSASYRQSRRRNAELTDARYAIEGGADYAANAADFFSRYGDMDGLVLGRSFAPKTQEALDAYRQVLAEFAAACREGGAQLVFVYFPAYSQVYVDDAPRVINETLRRMCDELNIRFVDLTDGFREDGRGQVLHLAPVDYHLNPAGNRVFAKRVAEALGSTAVP